MSTAEQITTDSRTRRSLVAGTVGNFVEWYEFVVALLTLRGDDHRRELRD